MVSFACKVAASPQSSDCFALSTSVLLVSLVLLVCVSACVSGACVCMCNEETSAAVVQPHHPCQWKRSWFGGSKAGLLGIAMSLLSHHCAPLERENERLSVDCVWVGVECWGVWCCVLCAMPLSDPYHHVHQPCVTYNEMRGVLGERKHACEQTHTRTYA